MFSLDSIRFLTKWMQSPVKWHSRPFLMFQHSVNAIRLGFGFAFIYLKTRVASENTTEQGTRNNFHLLFDRDNILFLQCTTPNTHRTISGISNNVRGVYNREVYIIYQNWSSKLKIIVLYYLPFTLSIIQNVFSPHYKLGQLM